MPDRRKCDHCKASVTATESQDAGTLLLQLAPKDLSVKHAEGWVLTTFRSICYQCAEGKVRDESL